MFRNKSKLMMNMQAKKGLIISFLALSLIACAGKTGSSSGATNTSSLTLDQVSTVPLINGQPQSFYVYATNNSNSTMSNITWTIDSQQAPVSLLQTAKAKLDNLIHKTDDNQAITIKDSSECVDVAAHQSCRVLLQANYSGVYHLHANSDKQKLTLLGGAGVIQTNIYTPINSGSLADMLTITPINEVSYKDGIGSANFFVINNGTNSVQLDMNALKANLPANASLNLGNCPQPLPGSTSCQVRVVITNPTNSTTQELDIPLLLSGEMINSDSSKTVLPKQNGDSHIKATTKQRGVIQYVFSQGIAIDNSYANVTTANVSGVISNTGTGSLTINSLVANSDILSITQDNCSGKSLGQGEVCSYKVNFDISKMTNNNSDFININYLNEAGGEVKSANSGINWTYIAPLPLANPSINISVGRDSLDQEHLTTMLNITNNGNVALSNISMPIMDSNSSHISITNGSISCANTLAVGSTCNYIITYSPIAPSENTPIIFSGISATHPDNRGGNVTSNFSNSTSINVSSIFEGLVTSDTVLTLTEGTSSGAIIFTNTGNNIATIKAISFTPSSSANLVIDNNGCEGKELAPTTSCEVGVKLSSITSSGSGNGVLDIMYDNHSGSMTATSSNSNISWLVGKAPSLQVVFANNSLVTPITVESTTVVTLTNNGRDDLTNIQIPILSAPFTYISGVVNGCAIDGSQNLAMGHSCTLTLKYNPSTAHSTKPEGLGSFSANYDNNGISTLYITNPYSITITALSLGDLSFSPSSVTQSVNWAKNSQTTEVTITNVGEIAVTLGAITSNQNEITTSGCSDTLKPAESCILSVIGNYTSSVNGVLTIPYADVSGSRSNLLNVTANYQVMPTVTPNLVVVANNLFNQNIELGVNQTANHTISLTNATTAMNNGDRHISIPQASLKPSDGNGVTYSLSTDRIPANPCDLSQDPIVLNGGDSCNYDLTIIGGSTKTTTSNVIWSMGYNYNSYTSSSTNPTSTAGIPNVNNFNVEVTAKALLSIMLDPPNQVNNFSSIEQGLMPPPMIKLIIRNIGTGAMDGVVKVNLPNGISGDFSQCDSLGAGEACHVELRMSTAAIINGNLNTIDLNYNDGNTLTIADFPSIPYSVVPALSPAISMTSSVTACVIGDGTIATPCMNNPDNKGGTASSMKVRLTFTNTSITTAATTVSLPVVESALFTTQGYTLSSNTCGSGVAANGGTCVMEYSMPSTATTTAINPDISTQIFFYNITYDSRQMANRRTTQSDLLNVNIDIVDPVLTIEPIGDIKQGENKDLMISLGSLYQSAAPIVSLITENPTGGGAIGVTVNNPTCLSPTSNVSSCSGGSVITSNSTPITNGYRLNATSFVGNIIGSQPFNVITSITEFRVFVTASIFDGNLGGFTGADAKCQKDGNNPDRLKKYKALLAGNEATRIGASYLRSDGITIILQSATTTNLNVTDDGTMIGPNLKTSINDNVGNLPWSGFQGQNCNNWSSSLSNTSGSYGDASRNNSLWFFKDVDNCSSIGALYCVEQ